MMPRLYLLGGIAAVIASLAAVIASLAAVIWLQSQRIDRLQLANAALEAEIKTCDARVTNLTEDNDSDSQVDAMDDLTDVPDSWLRPERADHN